VVNLIWMILVVSGVLVAARHGEVSKVTESAMTSAQLGVETVLGLIGVMILWLGIMKIAEEAGLVKALADFLRPLVQWIFPSIPKGHKAMGSILMNMSANLFGLGPAATPFGLKAMQELQELNEDKETASDAMVTFLAMNTSSVTIIPGTVIALRAATGSVSPTEIVGTTIIATICSTVVALSADYILRKYRRRR